MLALPYEGLAKVQANSVRYTRGVSRGTPRSSKEVVEDCRGKSIRIDDLRQYDVNNTHRNTFEYHMYILWSVSKAASHSLHDEYAKEDKEKDEVIRVTTIHFSVVMDRLVPCLVRSWRTRSAMCSRSSWRVYGHQRCAIKSIAGQ